MPTACPTCGAPLPAPGSQCLACLLAIGLEGPVDAPFPPDSGEAPSLPLFGGKYQASRVLGRGGMGVVYLAWEAELHREVAIKTLVAGGFAGTEIRQRFAKEAAALGRLHHPDIVAVYSVGEQSGFPFLAMEYVPGRDLASELRDHGPLDPYRAARLLQRVAHAVHHAHSQGILHRDIKPANILIGPNDTPKITDFGLAKTLGDPADLTLSGDLLGTSGFMPPEQIRHRQSEVGGASDVYGLGATLYCLLTGSPPFSGSSPADTARRALDEEPLPPRRLRPDVPPDLETIVLRCLEKGPGRRYPTAQALADDLGRWLQGQPIRARPVSWTERLWKWCLRNRRLAALSAALTLVVCVGLPVVLRREGLLRSASSRGAALAALPDAEARLRADSERTALARLAEGLERDPSQRAVAERIVNLLEERMFPVRTRTGRQTGVETVVFDESGTWVVAGGSGQQGGFIEVQDTQGNILLEATGIGGRITRVAASAPLGFVAAGGPTGGTVRRLSPNGDTSEWIELAYHVRGLAFVRLSSDTGGEPARREQPGLAVITKAGAELWSLAERQVRWRYTHSDSEVHQGAISRDGRRVVLADAAGQVILLGTETNGPPVRSTRGHQSVIRSVAFAYDHERFATASADGSAKVWRWSAGEPLATLPHTDAVYSAAFSGDGTRLLTASEGAKATLWFLDSQDVAKWDLDHPPGCRVYHARFAADERWVVTLASDKRLRLWSAESGRKLGETPEIGYPDACPGMGSLDRGTIVALAEPAPEIAGQGGAFATLAWIGHNNALARSTAAPDGVRPVSSLPRSEPPPSALHSWQDELVQWRASPTDALLISASKRGYLRLHRKDTGAELWRAEHHGPVTSAEFSPDGFRIVTGVAETQAIRVWDTQTGSPLTETRRAPRSFQWVAFSTDGRWIVTDPGDVFPVAVATGRSPSWLAALARALATNPTAENPLASLDDWHRNHAAELVDDPLSRWAKALLHPAR